MNKSVISSATLFATIRSKLNDSSTSSEGKDKLIAFCNSWIVRNSGTEEYKKPAVLQELREMQRGSFSIKLPEKKVETLSIDKEDVVSTSTSEKNNPTQ